MNKSAEIRKLHSQGITVADIARKLGIKYQFAYNVINQGAVKSVKPNKTATPAIRKPSLTVQRLITGGFKLASHWLITPEGKLKLGMKAPKDAGVYAFAKNGVVQYVGVATKSLSQRLYFYANPGPKQSTNLRLKEILEKHLRCDPQIEIYAITVTNCFWNEWEIDGNLGLEGGLIAHFDIPWNKRGASPFLV